MAGEGPACNDENTSFLTICKNLFLQFLKKFFCFNIKTRDLKFPRENYLNCRIVIGKKQY
ncbi:MAG: hypothetical protein A3C43_05335 [Candidatus Schekmanbacteria bacterium RIFCSPHIGHO2_02_FULL_38_11]|uniref:Uncharacterized protein n=1 Tax=Candidatus Schekmanbacteria bacterium RIFCSPLOWO2_12_FULL_38_15 TaxID=1817883 RepID=A0A1F7SCB3_9BACT|nr:MAG: hypothetical protein A2043_03200 [Candidatus Schekmanbacteria bacterium GWA2_38_9]OGL51409.1 MAG: hypothetical protein A3G31_06030 [Candidatus Schekmanbacteria bacterium RIFCSPLOWO2_12_FULL_38_15]OGL51584.1 MAG: hypothetical protein A3H37_09535 [Candidatus Schekmanbacteria bacterium RIFCSPLOWO2_02_FULL_38_14]OGL53207.1 MAG: hypothetical protein A3C43_05335 [Candidatus Schekmanbacteria bacterium RIFCSPHIGHO2_02_FULL_38_11]